MLFSRGILLQSGFMALALAEGLSLTSAHSEAAPVTIDRLEASVNSDMILLSDLSRFRSTLKLRIPLDSLFSYTALATKGDKASDAEIVDFLIEEHLISQQYPVTDQDVENEINTIQSSNHMDRKALRAAIEQQGFTFDEYFELIRSSVSKHNLIDRDIRTKLVISDDDVKNYFYNHLPKQGPDAAPIIYRAKMIVVNPSNYKTPVGAHQVAEDALKDIKAGEPFEAAAKRMSEDANAQNGGDLGELTDDQMSAAIRDELKKLKIGQVSGVLGSAKTQFFILKLDDMKSGDSERFNRMKEEIHQQLAASEFQHQVSLWIERQKQSAFVQKRSTPNKPASSAQPAAPAAPAKG